VTNANGCTIENSVMKNTWGQEPQAGIDFEPDDASMQLVNCVVRNCRFENNNKSGILVYLQMLDGSPEVSIDFYNCYVTSANGWGLQISPIWASGPGGYVAFHDCVIEDIQGPGLYMPGKAAYRASIIFERCTWRRTAKAAINGFPAVPLLVTGDFPDLSPEYGGIQFVDSVLEDQLNRNFLEVLEPPTSSGVANLKGTLTVLNPYGARMNLGTKSHDISLQISTTPPAPTLTPTPRPATPTPTSTAPPTDPDITPSLPPANPDITPSLPSITPTPIYENQDHRVSPVVYPNPARGTLYFKFNVTEPKRVQVCLYSLSGERVIQISGEVNPGCPVLACSVAQLSPGVYLYQVQHGGRKDKGKICLVR